MQDNSGFFIISFSVGTPGTMVSICRYLFALSPSSNPQCQKVTNMSNYAYGHLILSTNQLIFLTNEASSPYSLYFYETTFGNTTPDWVNKMACPSGTCAAGSSESLISSTDSTKIYSFFTYGSTLSAYLVSFNSTNGNLIDSLYKSSSSCNAINSLTQKDTFLLAAITCTNNYLMLIDLSSFSFTSKLFSGSYLYSTAVEPNSGRFIVGGGLSSNCYISKFYKELISALPNFSSASLTMNLLSPGTSYISAASGVTIYSSITYGASNSSYSNVSVTYVQVSTYTSDVYLIKNMESYSLIEGNTIKLIPSLTCSSSGSTQIVYSITSLSSSTSVPSWVSINSATGELTISAPNVTTDTTYSFYISSTISGITDLVQKQIEVKVIDCSVLYCKSCTTSSSSTCSVCNDGYSLTSSGSCIVNVTTTSESSQTLTTSESAQTLTTASQSMTGSSTVIIGGVSLTNTSSLSSLWSMVNQIQLLLLLLLTGAYIPNDVKVVITGSKLLSNPLGSIPFERFVIFGSIMQNFDFSLSNPLYDAFGLKSDSSIYNTSSFFICLALFVLIHFVVLAIRKLLDCFEACKDCRLFRIILCILNKILNIMTYGYYIRLMLQLNQFFLATSLHEVYTFNVVKWISIVSFTFAIVIIVLCILLAGIIMHLSLSQYKTSEDEHNKIGEFFAGIKMNKKSKLFICLLVLRRSIFVTLLVILASISSKILIGIFGMIIYFLQCCTLCCIELLYIGYLVIVRPFTTVKGNLIEIVNEFLFMFLLAALIFLNTQSDWSSTKISAYSWVITSNSMVVLAIVLVDGIRLLCIYIYTKCTKPKEVQSTTIQLTPEFLRRIGAPPLKVYPARKSVVQQETDISRNGRYTYEESKIVIEESTSSVKFERK